MSILEIKNLSHMYDNKILFNNASLSINNGEHAGIVGLNGAGKSTFISILAGEVMQDSGEVKWLSSIKKEYLDQHADLDKSLSVMDYLKSAFCNLYELNERMEQLYTAAAETKALDQQEKLIVKAGNILDKLTQSDFFDIEIIIKKTAAGLGINNYGYDTLIGELSGGQRAKLMLAKLLLSKPDIMLLDEPTNFLDIEHIEWLAQYLNGCSQTFLVISHDTDFLDKVCKFIINIENGSIRKYGGNYSQFIIQREQNAKQYEEKYLSQRRHIEKLEDYINRNKARAATAGMANARKKQLEKIEILTKPSVIYDAVFDFPYIELITPKIITVESLEVGYDFPLLPPITFSLKSGDKLWIRGTNGIGKTTFLKTIVNIIPPKSGAFTFHPFIKIGYLEQDLEFYNTESNAVRYISDIFPKINYKDIRTLLAKVGIKNQMATNPIKELSGGEQVRVRLCALTNTPSNLLILDEPTNHLDIRAKDALKKGLIDYKGSLILVSHEKEFASAICNKILDVKQSDKSFNIIENK